jgi:hypothetical protein
MQNLAGIVLFRMKRRKVQPSIVRDLEGKEKKRPRLNA